MTSDRSVGRDEVIAILERLVSFDTESSRSNLDLIDYVEGYLRDLGVASVKNAECGGRQGDVVCDHRSHRSRRHLPFGPYGCRAGRRPELDAAIRSRCASRTARPMGAAPST